MRSGLFPLLIACTSGILSIADNAAPLDIINEDYQSVIYYLDSEPGESMELIQVVRELLPTSSDINRVKQVIEWLTMDPEEEMLQRIWPETLFLRDVFIVDNQTVVVDISGDSLENFNAGTRMEGLLIYSMVNSILESFPWYKNVWILRDGIVQETFLGHIDIEKPLQVNKSLIAEPEEVESEAGGG